MARIEAPFSFEQVAALNAYQRCGLAHPRRCPGPERAGPCPRPLVALEAGLVCPECDYKLASVPAYMADRRWIPIARIAAKADGAPDIEASRAGRILAHLKAVRSAIITLGDGDASMQERCSEAEQLAAAFGLPLEFEGEDDDEPGEDP